MPTCLTRAFAQPLRAAAFSLAAALGMLLVPGVAAAATSCGPSDTPGVERCVSGLAPAMLRRMYQAQEASNWCWAASIAMLLQRYGVQVAQEEVVRTSLGTAANERISVAATLDLLAHDWQDAAGHRVAASPSLLPPWRRRFGIAAPEVLEDLGQDRPLLVGVDQHAMVLVQLVYERRLDGQPLTPIGVRVLRAVVLDPGAGIWLRSLRPEEQRLDFVARVRVTPGETPRTLVAADGPH